jgi:CubicO group peptidase (beta-lactamase class C family)
MLINSKKSKIDIIIGSTLFAFCLLSFGVFSNIRAEKHSRTNGTQYTSGRIQPQRVVDAHSPSSGFGRVPVAEGLNALYPTELDSVISANMAQYHIPGLTACVVHGGEVVWNNAYGVADVNQGVPVTDSTLFMIASTSKAVVAAALMQLWEGGLFGLDDNINDYLPFAVNNPYFPGVPISFRMLLAHTSSIAYNDGAWLPLVTWGGDSPIPLGQFLQDYLVPGGPRYNVMNFNPYAPGTAGEYSNIAYALLGFLVEQISGQSFEQYCQVNIFAPLAMSETSWFLSELDIDHVAIPTEHNGSVYVPYPHPGLPVYPAGQLRTSSLQLARFLIAIMQNGEIDGVRILNSATVDAMTTVQYPGVTVIPGLEWGLGLFRWDTGNGWMWGHQGGFYGVYTEMYYHKAENFGQIMLSNRGFSDGLVPISWAVYDFARSYEPTSVPYAHLSPPAVVLNPNYPNPFNPSTTVSFSTATRSHVNVTVIDAAGHRVATLVDDILPPGDHRLVWDGRRDGGTMVASGLYLCRVKAGPLSKSIKMILLK